MRSLIPLLIAVSLLGCDAEPRSVPAEPAAPPAELKFPVDAARFMTFDRNGKPVVRSDRDEIPDHLRPFTAVLLGEKTRAPEGEVFHWQLDDDPRIGVAKRVDKSTLVKPSAAAWAGYDAGLTAWEIAIVHATEVSAPAGVTLRRPPARAKTRKPEAEARKIEIVGINDSLPARQAPAAASKSWKPVTVFYSETCGRCRRAMKWMDGNGVTYAARNIANRSDQQAMWSIADREGWSSISLPVLLIGDDRRVMSGWNA